MYYSQRTTDVASARLRLGESIPIDDAVILIEGRRRLEIPLVLSRARARKAYRLCAGGEGIIPQFNFVPEQERCFAPGEL